MSTRRAWPSTSPRKAQILQNTTTYPTSHPSPPPPQSWHSVLHSLLPPPPHPHPQQWLFSFLSEGPAPCQTPSTSAAPTSYCEHCRRAHSPSWRHSPVLWWHLAETSASRSLEVDEILFDRKMSRPIRTSHDLCCKIQSWGSKFILDIGNTPQGCEPIMFVYSN